MGRPKVAAPAAALVVLGLLAATAAGAGLTAAPGWTVLLAGATGAPANVPGLARPIVPDASHVKKAPTTVSRCLARWNSGAPARTRAWAAHHGTRADVTVMRTPTVGIGGAKGAAISQCAFGVEVGVGQLALIVAPLSGSRAAWRGELVRYRTRAALDGLVRRFNATVTTAGKLRLR
jgi:hypothetical protein